MLEFGGTYVIQTGATRAEDVSTSKLSLKYQPEHVSKTIRVTTFLNSDFFFFNSDFSSSDLASDLKVNSGGISAVWFYDNFIFRWNVDATHLIMEWVLGNNFEKILG